MEGFRKEVGKSLGGVRRGELRYRHRRSHASLYSPAAPRSHSFKVWKGSEHCGTGWEADCDRGEERRWLVPLLQSSEGASGFRRDREAIESRLR